MSDNTPAPLWDDVIQLCRDLQRGTVSAVELMRNVYARINALNPQVNALGQSVDEKRRWPSPQRPIECLLANVAHCMEHGGAQRRRRSARVLTTWGFKPFAERIETQDSGLAARMRKAGAIFIGHSNMPEFGLGSNTFNAVFGATLNPYDPTKTAGGSSGGAAVALATDMLPLADGSDMGGSLRNPASFCNVVGLRFNWSYALEPWFCLRRSPVTKPDRWQKQ